MFEDTRKFVIENVMPAYDAYCEHRDDKAYGLNQLMRKGLTSVGSLYHLREHFPKDNRPTVEDLIHRCQDYGLVRDINNLAKHGQITRYTPIIRDLKKQLHEALTYTGYRDAEGEYWATDVEVYVSYGANVRRTLSEILFAVVMMWRDELSNRLKIDLDAPKPPPQRRHLSRAEARASIARMTLRQGEMFMLHLQVLRFNYELNRTEPVNLTGYKPILTLQKMPHVTVHMVVQPVDDKGPLDMKPVEFDLDIPMTPAQKAYHQTLNTDQQAQLEQVLIWSNPELVAKMNAIMRKALGT